MVQETAEILVKGKADLKNATTSLDSFNNKAKKAAKSADLTNAAMGELSETMSVLGGDVKNAVNMLSQGFDKLDKKIEEQKQSFNRLSTAIEQTKKKYKEFGQTQKQAAAVADSMLGNTTRGAAQANRFNSANFLAQFQDIAVTSAMGMNPMLIAIQQGTQLQYILAQSNAPLKDFVAGLKSAFSTAGLLTIGLTGVIAALIQLVNWSKVGETVLHGLGNIFDFIGEHIVTVSALVLVLVGRFVWLKKEALGLTVIENAAKGMWSFAKAATAAKLAMAGDWLKANKTFLIITVTVTALAAAFEWLYKKITGNSFIDSLGDTFHNLAEKIAGATDSLKDFDKYISESWSKLNKEKLEDMYSKLDTRTQVYERTLHEGNNILFQRALAEGKTIDLYDEELKQLHDLANAQADYAVEKEAAAEAEKKEKKALEDAAKAAEVKAKAIEKIREAWDKLQISSQNKIQDLQMNISLIGTGTFEKTYVQTLADLKRQAESAGIDLYGEDNKYEQLQKDAEGIAKLTEEYEKLNDKVNFANSTVKGFFSDMRHGLRDGESAWESFGNAVTNVLDKILDKIMDIGVDTLFNIGYGYGKTSGWWGTTGQQVYSSPIGPTMPGASPLTGAANGGVFSNGIYSSPTLFKFAKGGKFGVMGEAGPEAVMPLTRSPDGSLGVRADNSGASPVVVNVINNSNAQAKVEQRQTSQGMEIDVMIDQLVAEKMNQPGTSSNSALRAFSNQKLIAR